MILELAAALLVGKPPVIPPPADIPTVPNPEGWGWPSRAEIPAGCERVRIYIDTKRGSSFVDTVFCRDMSTHRRVGAWAQ